MALSSDSPWGLAATILSIPAIVYAYTSFLKWRLQQQKRAGDNTDSGNYPKTRVYIPYSIPCRQRKIKRYLERRRAEKAKENPSDRAAESVARATWAIAILTLFIFGASIAQYITFANQLAVMQGQLHESQYEQRPWVYADIGAGGPIFRNQSGGLTIQIGFRFHNTGHQPAFYVSPDLEGYLSGEDGVVGSQIARERQKRRCGTPFQQPMAEDQIGVTVFPGQDVVFGAGTGIGIDSIESVKRFLKQRYGREMDIISPWIVGCIRYRSPDGELHQTGVVLTVGMSKPGRAGQFVLPTDPTSVDAGNIVMSPWIEGGTAYAY